MRCRDCYPLLLLGVGIVSLMGCGSDAPDTAPVSGIVTYQDKPLAEAYVSFLVEGSPIAVAQTNSEGKFTLSSVPIGEAKVSVAKTEAVKDANLTGPSATPEDMRKMYMEKMDNKQAPTAPKSAIPEKYADPKQSGLRAEVTSDSSKNDFKFELK
jgi:hypothetical protein